MTQPLNGFHLLDHVRIEQVDRPDEGRVWFHTRGLGKFGFPKFGLKKLGLKIFGIKKCGLRKL